MSRLAWLLAGTVPVSILVAVLLTIHGDGFDRGLALYLSFLGGMAAFAVIIEFIETRS
jgi:hypothetical protein